MKKNLIVLFVAFYLSSLGNNTIASPVANSWVYATILIKNEWGEIGTGFLVSRVLDANNIKIFLCTNKHVLNKNKKLRESATKIKCYLNEVNKGGKIVGVPHDLSLTFTDGMKCWKEHPDENVDVLVFDVTDLIIQFPNMVKKWGDYNLFVNKEILSREDITIGEEVFIVGYLSGYTQGENNFPIVRQGIIASQIGEKYIEMQNGKERVYRGFLVDGGVIPGSSGSPVILKPVAGRYVNNKLTITPTVPYLLGIIAETRYAYIRKNDPNDSNYTPSYAGLGLAFDASTINETIELFLKKNK
jgi:hypothetical protein